MQGDAPILHTERLLLRKPGADDIGSIIAIAGDWEVARRLARVPHPYTEEDARYFLNVIVPGETVWAITLRSSGAVVGMVGLTPSGEAGIAELGYYVDQGHWGRGIATEAAGSVVAYGFEGLKLQVITSGHFLDNPASGRVLVKLGFIESGRSDRSCLASGLIHPSVDMMRSSDRAEMRAR